MFKCLSAISGTSVLWRTVALSTASLWTTIVLESSMKSDAVGAFTKQRDTQLACYLKRSKQYAIDVYISLVLDDEVKISGILKKTILPHPTRCRSLRAELVDESQAHILFALPRHLPHLGTLGCSLRNHGAIYRSLAPPPVQLLSDKTYSPCLAHVDFVSSTQTCNYASGPFIHFGSLQFTTLKIRGPLGLWGGILTLLNATACSLRCSSWYIP